MRIVFKKSQSSMEFFTLVGFAFLTSIIIIAVSVSEIKEFRDKKEFNLIKDLGLKLQKEVAIANYVENGYQRTFDIPQKLEGSFNYTIINTNSTIIINATKTSFSAAMPFVEGNFTKGSNKITRANNKVYINK